jgi:hypothetical protein
VKPSPMDHQSTPSSRATFSSPTLHLPDLTNWNTHAFHPLATARSRMPMAAVVLPFPSPVFTSTREEAGARFGALGRSSGGCRTPLTDAPLPPVPLGGWPSVWV